MKLEKVLDRLNSLEKGSFIKVVNGLLATKKNTKEVEIILSGQEANLKNADSIQLAKIFEFISPAFVSSIYEEYSNSNSQLDILLDIITRDGNCIMRMDWFEKLYFDQIKKQKNAIETFKKLINSEKPTIDAERIRDYKIYEACLFTAYHNDESSNLDPKITADEQSLLDILAKKLELSQDEITMIKYSVLGIPKLNIDDIISDLKDKGIIFFSRKTNTVYVADEIVSLLRPIAGREVADKFYRRVLLQLREPQINQLCKKHSIDIKNPITDKIELLISSGVSFSSVLKEELFKPDVKIAERRKFISDLCDEKLQIKPSIKGSSLDEKVTNLILYFDGLYKDERLGISLSGYQKLLSDLEVILPKSNKLLRVTFQLQDETVLDSDYLIEYNIMPRDVLELLPNIDLASFAEQKGIKTRGNVIDNILEAYKDTENLYVENYVEIGNRDLNTLKENGIFIKEPELGCKFEDVTKYIMNNIGFNVNEKLRKKLNTEKDKMDVLITIDETNVVLVECKTVKDNGYNKFSAISRQVKSYKSLLEKNGYQVVKILVVAPGFSDDFVSDCGDDFDLNMSLITASSLVALYRACKESGKTITINMLMKDVLIQEDRIIRALLK